MNPHKETDVTQERCPDADRPTRTPVTRSMDPCDDLAIRATLIRYSTGIDTKDWPLFRTCFTSDCHATYGELQWDGVDALTTDFADIHAPLAQSMHRVLNIAVTADDASGASASSRSYCDAILINPAAEGGHLLQVYGVYTDHLTRTAEGWQIADREFRAVHYNGNLAVMALDADTVRRSYSGAQAS